MRAVSRLLRTRRFTAKRAAGIAAGKKLSGGYGEDRGRIMNEIRSFVKSLTLGFGAGVFGALLNSLALWALVYMRITRWAGIRIQVDLTPEWIYPRLVWGGIWGLLLAAAVLKRSVILRGLVFSLGPTIVQLLVIFPSAGKGHLGLSLGGLTPLLVIVVNAIWGVGASGWFSWTRSDR